MEKYYQHYKGDIYKFHFQAEDEHTGAPLAVYESGETGTIFVRPMEEFEEKFKAICEA